MAGARPTKKCPLCFGKFDEKVASEIKLVKKLRVHYTTIMKSEFTAIIEPAPEGGYWAVCPEVPGANGQGDSVEETKQNLIEAIQFILEDRRSDFLRGLPDDAIQEKILVG